MNDGICSSGIAILLGFAVVGVADSALGDPAASKVRVLIVTGGHDFERDAFFEMFKSFSDVSFSEARHDVEGPIYPANTRDEYKENATFDVIVLYDMWQKITDEQKANLITLLKRGKGLVSLHHSLANYQDWPEFEKIVGGKYFLAPAGGRPQSTFKHDVDLHVKLADPKHPIVAGLTDFDIHDEAYGKFAVGKNVHPLLTTKHPESGDCIGWAKRYGNARVCYIQLGHDSKAYRNESYRRLVHQAIRWAADLVPVPRPDKDGFVPLFNGRNLDGWVVMGDPAGFAVKEAVVESYVEPSPPRETRAGTVKTAAVIHSDGEKGGQWLRSVRQYSDFILKVDWRVSRNGNSGVFIRCTEDGYPWVTGSEVQISNEPRDDAHCTGSLYGSVAVRPRPDESADRWHTFEIQCVGNRITVISDGVKVVDADCDKIDALKNKPRAGYIGLQDSHAPKGSYIEYRNIRIKDLSAGTGAGKPKG